MSDNGNIRSIKVIVFANLTVYYQSIYKFFMPVSNTIRDVFEELSKNELTFHEDSFSINWKNKN